MRRKIYLLINTLIGKEREVRDTLRRTPGVLMADMITGRYDLVVVIEESSPEMFFATILEKVRSIEGITRTETNLVVE